MQENSGTEPCLVSVPRGQAWRWPEAGRHGTCSPSIQAAHPGTREEELQGVGYSVCWWQGTGKWLLYGDHKLLSLKARGTLLSSTQPYASFPVSMAQESRENHEGRLDKGR